MIEINISEYEANELVHALTSGLTYEGELQKQFYLEKALVLLVGRAEMERMKNEEGWYDGLPA